MTAMVCCLACMIPPPFLCIYDYVYLLVPSNGLEVILYVFTMFVPSMAPYNIMSENMIGDCLNVTYANNRFIGNIFQMKYS